MSDHTLGPWGFHPHYEPNERIDVPGDNRVSSFTAWTTRISAGEKTIAEVVAYSISDGWLKINNPEENLANARLIAAAPELLEALQNAIHWLNYGTDSERHAVDMARTAIAKATGVNT